MDNAKSVCEVVVPTYASTSIVYVFPLFYTLANLGLISFIILNMQTHLKYAKAVGVSTSLWSYWDEVKGKIREVSWLSHQLTFLCPHVQSESHLGLLGNLPLLGNPQGCQTISLLPQGAHRSETSPPRMPGRVWWCINHVFSFCSFPNFIEK